MTIDLELLAADANLVINDDGVMDLTALTKKFQELEKAQAVIEELLGKISSELREVQEIAIPEKMAELGVKQFKLNDGWEVKVNQYYSASIGAENKEAAFAWLRKHKHDDIIKNEITTSFGRGEDEKAKLVAGLLEEAGITYAQKEGVHSQTLKAFVKGEIEHGRELPMDLFSVYIGNRAKLIPPKG